MLKLHVTCDGNCLPFFTLFGYFVLLALEKEKAELVKEVERWKERVEYEKQPNIAFEKENEELGITVRSILLFVGICMRLCVCVCVCVHNVHVFVCVYQDVCVCACTNLYGYVLLAH